MTVAVQSRKRLPVPALVTTHAGVAAGRVLAVLVALSFLVRATLGWLRATPVYFGDEYLYSSIAKSIAETRAAARPRRLCALSRAAPADPDGAGLARGRRRPRLPPRPDDGRAGDVARRRPRLLARTAARAERRSRARPGRADARAPRPRLRDLDGRRAVRVPARPGRGRRRCCVIGPAVAQEPARVRRPGGARLVRADPVRRAAGVLRRRPARGRASRTPSSCRGPGAAAAPRAPRASARSHDRARPGSRARLLQGSRPRRHRACSRSPSGRE